MNQETLEGIPNTEVSTQAIAIIRDNLPEWFKENLWYVIQTCIDHEDWCERLVEKDQIDLLFTNDIVHDIKGLLNKDEHFLPRI
jgi:hypothetical protein